MEKQYGKRVEKDLSLHGRKGHFTEGGGKAHTDELGIKLYPLENVPASSPTAHIFCTSLSIYHGSTLNGSMIFLMGEHVSILCRTSICHKDCCDMCSPNASPWQDARACSCHSVLEVAASMQDHVDRTIWL